MAPPVKDEREPCHITLDAVSILARTVPVGIHCSARTRTLPCSSEEMQKRRMEGTRTWLPCFRASVREGKEGKGPWRSASIFKFFDRVPTYAKHRTRKGWTRDGIRRIVSCRVISCRVISCRVISCSSRIISCSSRIIRSSSRGK